MKTIYMYFDDSGVFHKKERYFVYGGYVFFSKEERDKARREYRTLSDKIKAKLECDEVKSYGLKAKHKRSLNNVMKKYESLSVCINIRDIKEYILADKRSIHRFKDYALKRCIKAKFIQLIRDGLVNPDEDIHLIVNVDEQPTSTDGFYDLRSSIKEELRYGVGNFNYAVFHPPILNGDFEVDVYFRDSKNDYLIQAADILANSIWCSHKFKNPNLRNKLNHFYLQLP